MRRALSQSRHGAALIIVLAFVVLLTGLTVAYFSQTITDRQIAHTSFNQSNADQLAASAVGIILGDLRQEIIKGSASPAPSFGPATSPGPYYLYNPSPSPSPNAVPKRSGTPLAGATPIPNLVRRSVRDDPIASPGLGSRASAVNSTSDVSANNRSITLARWNKHYLIPKLNTGDDQTDPVSSFAPPDWVMVTAEEGAAVLTTPKTDSNGTTVSPVGRYAYALYDEGGLADLNVAGYPSGTNAIQSGRKGSIAFADLTALGQYPLPNSSSPYQVDRIIGWRNYATTQAANKFSDTNFASNLQGSATATSYYTFVTNNTTGFLTVRSTPSPSPYPWNGRTDQMFLNRQQLIEFRKAAGFSSNALQYLGTFSRETNSPSFSPITPAGSSIDYAALASSTTAVNPNFLLRRVQGTGTGVFTRFDGTPANGGEALIKTRFPLSRLAWITYKGPSAVVYTANNSDAAITQLTNLGVPLSIIQAGTPANIKKCFGLVWDSRSYIPASGTTPSVGQQWVYISPSSASPGGTFDPVSNPGGSPASDIKGLDRAASENREPDFFELLRASILDGSLGQNTAVPGTVTTGVTGAPSPGPSVFPDVHMSNKAHHILSIGAAIFDQADPDSVPTRIQFKPPAAAGTNWWTAYGVESLPYITQLYPISGISPSGATQWATYLLFQLSNPHTGPNPSPSPPQVRLRADGNVATFTGGNGQTYQTANPAPVTSSATGQSTTFVIGAYGPSPTPTPAPAASPAVSPAPASGSASLPGFEKLPTPGSGTAISQYVGFRLPNYTVAPAASGNPPQLVLYFGTDSTHQFNATMEYNVAGTSNWVPYNHFIGINDRSSWIYGATLPVRTASSLSGTPSSTNDQFNTGRLTQSPPYCFMKADPRATRFGIFQVNPNITTTARITNSVWPTASSTVPNGYGGSAADGTPPVAGNPLEHVPLRFAAAPYYPATFCINDGQTNSIRNTITTSYADYDGIIRLGDNCYADPANNTTGSSTPFYTTTLVYHPIILNRPFRSVAELGYAFRDLPWKSLDLFSDRSADSGLLDVFSIVDEPVMVAGRINLNTQQAAPMQTILAGSIWDEFNSANVYSKATSAVDSAQTMAPLLVSATSAAPLLNKSGLVSRTGLPNLILPTNASQTDQLVKAQREAVPRAIASVTQTRTWNLMIDVIAQSGRYPPTATTAADLPKFIVEGEQRYWVHVAIDRFTGQVIDRQVEVVKE